MDAYYYAFHFDVLVNAISNHSMMSLSQVVLGESVDRVYFCITNNKAAETPGPAGSSVAASKYGCGLMVFLGSMFVLRELVVTQISTRGVIRA